MIYYDELESEEEIKALKDIVIIVSDKWRYICEGHYNNDFGGYQAREGHITKLELGRQYIKKVPESIGNLKELRELGLDNCNLDTLPEAIKNLKLLNQVDVSGNPKINLSDYFDYLKPITKEFYEKYEVGGYLASVSDMLYPYHDIVKNLWINEESILTYPYSMSNLKYRVMCLMQPIMSRNPSIKKVNRKKLTLRDIQITEKDKNPIIDPLPDDERKAILGLKKLIKRDNERKDLEIRNDDYSKLESRNLPHAGKVVWINDNHVEKCYFEFSKENILEFIQYFPNLRELTIESANIKEFPKFLTSFKHLTYLNLSGNDIPSIPENIGELENLEELELSYNKIRSLPLSLCNLKKLKKLSVSDNIISFIPDCIKKMQLNTFEYKENPIPREKLYSNEEEQEEYYNQYRFKGLPIHEIDVIRDIENYNEDHCKYNELFDKRIYFQKIRYTDGEGNPRQKNDEYKEPHMNWDSGFIVQGGNIKYLCFGVFMKNIPTTIKELTQLKTIYLGNPFGWYGFEDSCNFTPQSLRNQGYKVILEKNELEAWSKYGGFGVKAVRKEIIRDFIEFSRKHARETIDEYINQLKLKMDIFKKTNLSFPSKLLAEILEHFYNDVQNLALKVQNKYLLVPKDLDRYVDKLIDLDISIKNIKDVTHNDVPKKFINLYTKRILLKDPNSEKNTKKVSENMQPTGDIHLELYMEFHGFTSNGNASDKFWKIVVQGTTIKRTYGSIGDSRNPTITSYNSKAEALKEAEKLIRSKKKKGYQEI